MSTSSQMAVLALEICRQYFWPQPAFLCMNPLHGQLLYSHHVLLKGSTCMNLKDLTMSTWYATNYVLKSSTLCCRRGNFGHLEAQQRGHVQVLPASFINNQCHVGHLSRHGHIVDGQSKKIEGRISEDAGRQCVFCYGAWNNRHECQWLMVQRRWQALWCQVQLVPSWSCQLRQTWKQRQDLWWYTTPDVDGPSDGVQ